MPNFIYMLICHPIYTTGIIRVFFCLYVCRADDYYLAIYAQIYLYVEIHCIFIQHSKLCG